MINKKLEELSTQTRGQPTKTRLAPRVCVFDARERNILKLSVIGMDKGNLLLLYNASFVFRWDIMLQGVRNYHPTLPLVVPLQ